jgi:hypothetical protein
MAATGGVFDLDRNRLYGLDVPAGSAVNSGGGGGGGGNSTPGPSYLDTFRSIMTPTGGYDPTRMSNIGGATSKLYDTSGNYGDVNNSISSLQNTRGNYGATDISTGALQKFASTGGLSAEDLGQIRRPLFDEFEKTGGYSQQDLGNIRARSNAGISSTYQAMQDKMARDRVGQGGFMPGLSSANFKLARQSAQDIGTNRRNTEVDIANQVRTGRMDAAKTIAGNQLALQPIKNQATLSGYGTAGQLDLGKNSQIDSAMEAAGRLGLGRQAQIDAAMEAAAGIDTNLQDSINKARLSAAGGLQQEDLGRASIGASSAAAKAALDAQNERFLIGERNSNMNTANAGLSDLYKAAPGELLANQDLLRGYRSDAAGQQQGLIGARTAQGSMPGLGSDIMTGLGIAGKVAGIGAPILGGFGSYGSAAKAPTPWSYGGYGPGTIPNLTKPGNPMWSYGGYGG